MKFKFPKKKHKVQLEKANHNHNLKYTFMMVSNTEGKPKSFTLPGFIVKNIALFLIILICCIGLLLYQYIQINFLYSKNKSELTSLKEINKNQQEKINELDTYTKEIDDKLSYLNQLEQAVKDMVGLKSESNNVTDDDISYNNTIQLNYSTEIASRSYYIRSDTKQENYDNMGKLDNIQTTLTELEESILLEEIDLSSLKTNVKNRLDYLEAYPNKWPTYGRISSTFGYRKRPYNGFHSGIDIANSTGTSIVAAGKGKVIFAGYRGGYGYTIIIDHGYGLKTLYAHLSSIKTSTGKWVDKGQFIAKMGSTGYSTGPHLHFEVQVNGKPQNPYNYLGK